MDNNKNIIINNNPPIANGEENYIFISYSHKDKDYVYEDLWGIHSKGFKFWYDDGICAGDVWNETVEGIINNPNCKLVIFFLSENMISSSAIRKEMELVKKYNKSFFSVNIFNEDISDILGRALSKKVIKLSDMSIYMDFFNEDIIYVQRVEKNYLDNIAKQCMNRGLEATVEIINVKKNTKKILVVCKNSSFSNSIINGIYDYFSKKENVIVDKKLIDKSLSRIDSAIEFNKVLNENIEEYDGFIVRTPEKYNDQTLSCIKKILSLNKKIVLLDIEISSDKLKEFDCEPTYIGSDFAIGGALLGERIGDVANKLGTSETTIVLFEGPYANLSTKMRCESLNAKLIETNPNVNVIHYNLPSLNANIALDYIKTQALEWTEKRIFNNKNAIIFCGIDNIAVEVMRALTKHDDVLNDAIKKAKKLVIVGYDGIRDANNEIVLKNYGIDFLTIDVIPFKQGVNAGQKIYSMLFEHQNDSKVLVQPELIEYIKFKSEKYDSAQDIEFLLNNKKAFIFDLDGTIADTETLHWEAYNEVLKEYDVYLKPDDIKKYIGHSELQIYDMIRDDFDIDFDNNEFIEKRIMIYLDLVEKKSLKPFKFITDILQNKNIKSALVTSQIPPVVDRLLSLWDLDKYFPKKYRFCCHDGRFTKQKVYENISSYLDFEYALNANNVVLFEDSMHYLKKGISLGFTTIGIEHQYNHNLLKDCDAIMTANISNGVFVGLCGLDAVYYSKQDLPAENTKIKITDFSLEVGGPAANAAITYAKLGGDAFLISAIGNNEEGKLIKSKLKALNVKVIDIIDDLDNTKCNVSFIYVNLKNGSRTIFSGQTNANITSSIEWGEVVKKAKFVLYDGNLPKAENKLIQYVEYYDKDLVIDAGSYKPGFPECFYRANTVISSNNFVDLENNDVFAIQKKYGFKYAAKTRGEKPIIFNDEGKLNEIPLLDVKALDTLGAGDIIHGAYCYFRYAKNLSFSDSLKKAADVASYSVTQKGVVKGLNYALEMISKTE